MDEHTKTGLGEIKIHQNVISSITIETTKQIEGVWGIGSSLRSQVLEFIGKKGTSAIKIDFDKNNEVTITVPIIVKFGYNIPEIAAKVQENVKLAIENATSIAVKEINVIIQEIERK